MEYKELMNLEINFMFMIILFCSMLNNVREICNFKYYVL